MKTLKKNDKYERLPSTSKLEKDKIDEMVKYGWEYVSKEEWKKNVRGEVKEKKKKKVKEKK